MSNFNKRTKNLATASDVASAAASWAISKLGCPYSQARRLQVNVFDCSSLVARAYSAQGKEWFYGGSVPISCNEVADSDFALIWPDSYTAIGKKFGGKDVIAMATQPGDIQFVCTDSSTTRSNKITHVAMVADKDHIVHARGTKYGVVKTSINTYAGKICAVVRYNPSCTLRMGMRGYRVKALQEALGGLAVDGHYAERTRDAVKDFQKDHGLPVTGKADPLTLVAINAAAPSNGDTDTQTTQVNPGKVTINGDHVNLRTGPGLNYGIIQIAHKGDAFDTVDTDGWLPVIVNGSIAWTSKRYTTVG